jgi:hypothetical protein
MGYTKGNKKPTIERFGLRVSNNKGYEEMHFLTRSEL